VIEKLKQLLFDFRIPLVPRRRWRIAVSAGISRRLG
jgi:hypothetical protein